LVYFDPRCFAARGIYREDEHYMVEISLLSGHESVLDEDGDLTGLELLEVTQKSLLLDLFFDSDCIARISPYIAEIK
jgi:hypothetical protein